MIDERSLRISTCVQELASDGDTGEFFIYDALNRRVVKYFPEGSEYGLPKVCVNDDRWRVLEVYEADDWSHPAAEFVDGAGIDEHVTVEADPSGPGAMIYYPLTDDLGSAARFIKHGSATPSAVINYDPYGRLQNSFLCIHFPDRYLI
ncbi:MAG TPA: hypothetical protein PL033_08065 [Candidatus Brocadiia bacterium]|nr:hypothetical protein [Candidatus Brocadiia bacterium]